jgi:pimeloyl-ACP methyl ester carboxylesterase
VGPELKWTTRPEAPSAVVLVLHGGTGRSHLPTSWLNLAVIRMLPIAWAVARAGRGSFAVARLRFTVRGWNGAEQSPVADTRWALDELSATYPDVPIAIVGHSMGGRAALAVAGDPRVVDVVGLAPWVEGGEGGQAHDAQKTLVIHALTDRMTSPAASRRLVEALQARGLVASFVGLRSGDHAMLRRATTWDGLVGGYLRASLDAEPEGRTAGSPGAEVAALGAAASARSIVTVI